MTCIWNTQVSLSVHSANPQALTPSREGRLTVERLTRRGLWLRTASKLRVEVEGPEERMEEHPQWRTALVSVLPQPRAEDRNRADIPTALHTHMCTCMHMRLLSSYLEKRFPYAYVWRSSVNDQLPNEIHKSLEAHLCLRNLIHLLLTHF